MRRSLNFASWWTTEWLSFGNNLQSENTHLGGKTLIHSDLEVFEFQSAASQTIGVFSLLKPKPNERNAAAEADHHATTGALVRRPPRASRICFTVSLAFVDDCVRFALIIISAQNITSSTSMRKRVTSKDE
jgi:hypothetical protein